LWKVGATLSSASPFQLQPGFNDLSAIEIAEWLAGSLKVVAAAIRSSRERYWTGL
jgi:hypothetical protein